MWVFHVSLVLIFKEILCTKELKLQWMILMYLV